MKKISEADARTSVLAHIDSLDLAGWRYELAELRRSKDRVWTAVFDTYDPHGSLVDGPIAFHVDSEGVRLVP